MATETWRNRIIGEGSVDPKSLLSHLHPLNARTHPTFQAEALEGSLGEIGWVQRIIVNRTTGNLIDGHLRVAMASEQGQSSIPVTYVELSEGEENLVLATLDPIAALADTDAAKLSALLDEVNTGSSALQTMLSNMAEEQGILDGVKTKEPPDDFPEFDEDISTDYQCPSCQYEWSGKPR